MLMYRIIRTKVLVQCMVGICGGITGPSRGGEIIKCINYGNVTGTHNVGGIAATGAGTISLCANFGNIKGETPGQSDAIVGGIIGYASASINEVGDSLTIDNSYNCGSIEESDSNNSVSIGGITGLFGGYENAKVSFTNCYSTGQIISDGTNIGGFIGRYVSATGAEITFTNCYWKPENGAEYSMSNEARRDEILAITADLSQFTTSLGTNYAEAEDNEYPILAWQSEYVEF